MDQNTYYFTLGQLMLEWKRQDHGQRFGQYVINSDQVKEIVKTPNPALFYESDAQVALQMLMEMAPLE